MPRKFLILTTACVLACSAMPAHAGWHEFIHRTKLDWHRNNVWPQPWVNADRVATCQWFDLMAQNGWCQQSTITSHHFDITTQQLTEAGRMKVQQVIQQHPEGYRTLFVVSGKDDKETAIRVDSVQTIAALLVTDGTLPEIRRVTIPPRGWPAEDIDAIGTQFRATAPAPRLQGFGGGATTD